MPKKRLITRYLAGHCITCGQWNRFRNQKGECWNCQCKRHEANKPNKDKEKTP